MPAHYNGDEATDEDVAKGISEVQGQDFAPQEFQGCPRQGSVLLVGEPMALFTAECTGSLQDVNEFSASIAGAELNVVVGLTRLGHQAQYVAHVGQDPFGIKIHHFLQQHGIDDSALTVDPHHSTGFMLKSKVTKGDPATAYWRSGSAASAINPQDVEGLDLSGTAIVHITGILPALSASAAAATQALMAHARREHVFLSFDPNLRPALWENAETMRSTLRDLSSQADLVLPGIGEGEELFSVSSVEEIGKAFIDNGARYVVVKDGPRGAYATDGKRSVYVPAFVVSTIVDTVGAGDGFAAGLLSALLESASFAGAMDRACAVGAMQTQVVSDNEGLPTPNLAK
ncbi:2-keto-3-deoxygluconate kinase [Bombiscardovia apis]|uniref:2-keto-3-deoxygluconate kinase n=1 Tax=Bombiscardovia apis TaxID=2932182 RepID=A0ABN6SGD3_9BIFI|nr:sugar kinase [Bombiscardovia apis]BDR53961.1 2-keto-3-deoxygluconate kinase [Bombiscardovia apis]